MRPAPVAQRWIGLKESRFSRERRVHEPHWPKPQIEASVQPGRAVLHEGDWGLDWDDGSADEWQACSLGHQGGTTSRICVEGVCRPRVSVVGVGRR